MIKMMHRDGTTAPVVTCDICGDMISTVEEGAAVFSCSAAPNAKTEVLHAHKGECHDKAEERFGDNSGWDELGLHLYRICFNSGLNYAEEKAREQRLRDAGL
jgi:hypothetical protein